MVENPAQERDALMVRAAPLCVLLCRFRTLYLEVGANASRKRRDAAIESAVSPVHLEDA